MSGHIDVSVKDNMGPLIIPESCLNPVLVPEISRRLAAIVAQVSVIVGLCI